MFQVGGSTEWCVASCERTALHSVAGFLVHRNVKKCEDSFVNVISNLNHIYVLYSQLRNKSTQSISIVPEVISAIKRLASTVF